MMVGMFFSIAIAILWERWRNIVYTAEDLQDLLLLPLLEKILSDDCFRALFLINSDGALAWIETERNFKESLFISSC